ncbi:precorrin 6A synthase [Rhizobium sp. Leaf384]|uniref:precorrin-6A synthase (deacetylating) n=1 Tax=unclassified Rhizobium TaxID=2613769 RepID=UPI000713C712|nr:MULTISPECIES: precorrin-6A synthase (deacetylating) [unclassified Rhizobium]KQR75991.1 precorrin 6A synthase [Rhizobium sp. Leaf341]KQS76602.1 precorrin 6A synthase [Rhizobium sp. Leaf383]KQS77870.1 precorrin 6A synthase [Rhizobium sp. Leaf384]
MRRILVIGIGTGNPDHLTLEAVRAIGEAQVIFVPTKGDDKVELADVRRGIIARNGSASVRLVEFAVPRRQTDGIGYRQGVDLWHAAIAGIHEQLFLDHLADGETGAFLVWGDPMLYDSTLRILERVRDAGHVAFDVSVLPGITSMQLLAARHRIPINDIGLPVTITPARRLSGIFPRAAEAVVVMLDGEEAFLAVDELDTEIFWGAYLGLPQEITIAGRLGAVRSAIVEARAAARARHGWIMDIYLLRTPSQGPAGQR